MATNLCAECGIKLTRPEYQKHMQEVHGVSIQHDSDDERDKEAPAADEGAADAKPQRQRRRGGNKEGAAEGADGAAEGAEGEDGARPPRERRRRGGRKPAGEGAEGEAAPVGDFACTECDRTFASQQGLRRHLQAKHPESEATAAAVAAAAAEAPAPGARRGGRGRGRGPKAEGGEGAAEGAAAEGAEGAKPAGRGRGRGGRTGRGRGAAAAPVPDDPNAAAAMAAAAAKAAIGGAPAEPKTERQVTLFRCKQCEQGFKSRNRAREHVTEAHPGDVPAEAPAEAPGVKPPPPEGTELPPGRRLPAPVVPMPADALLEVVEVTTSRGPRASRRRKPGKAADGDEAAEGEEGAAEGGEGAGKGGRARGGGRGRGGRGGDAAAPAADGAAAAPSSDAKRSGAPTDELAALGITSS
ncbi:hypothetical protein HYH02_000738 [Chlamydomonas schloesseri]|uniref:C2H2-type domain-containing protein n=1 Tax=Chlamydomonas schloesseri TaxID=2026947 RepID=A0A835WXD3_9CHLO|nr:hypothetical protein HYH02_000738 [Chlamydomonas schloesseri]|eukprot:KAG2454908.1 hypothetical protein HYH02_000738 [Chlamydomonas schloesseri]